MLAFLTLLAEGEAAKGPPQGLDPMVMLLAMAVPFLLLIYLPARREKKQRQLLLASVDKGDKVIVSGAFLGTVVQVEKGDEKDPEDKLVLKIDENANIRMRVLRSSVTRVYKKDAKEGT
jgi:preprotein translocase subunit YajC